ncbi:cystathionine beta-lyase [Bradyrhizobium sp. 31Argb]|uniref:cystathionine beta-lyase n=1 Tax=unclassified Bradyrhizobium TaxID=2631580 RepID=UPI00102E3F2B|nr:cystathionine beta-lyase [Bradyrhizobium sp. Leo170]TAI66386.1 cystathionine beta-lyase [Bradyrhizobium sp. Leo170]
MKKDTLLVRGGRAATGPVNPPISRASTILFKDLAAFDATRADRFGALRYGIHGTDTLFALEHALAKLEGCHRAIVLPSGLAAITAALTAVVKAGDHLLMVDTVYGPTRAFCDGLLARNGVETTYYDPLLGSGIADLIGDNTRAIFCESPGSLTFEVQDVPAIAKAAHARSIPVLLDNTWASPLFFDALAHGVDISIQAATKYICGHSDVMMGTIATTERWWRPVRNVVADLGFSTSPDDCYLVLRGMRTLGVRMRHQMQSALTVARWLQAQPDVRRVLHPGLPHDPGHALWSRDFTGSSALFGVELAARSQAALTAFIDTLELFGIGSSWGGYESLALPARFTRTARPFPLSGTLVRLHIGLEDSDDLIADLTKALAAMRAAETAAT